MIKAIKSNKFISLLLFIMCLIILFNPTIYAKSCINAISVWGTNVLPLLFPFFVLTRLLVGLNQQSSNPADKYFCKTMNVPNGGFLIFFLSVLSGYPMGAKLICSLYENKRINRSDAEKMMSFCSVSGPMFMLGTVGIIMLQSFKAGLIILIANIISAVLNGLFWRNHGHKNTQNNDVITLENDIKKDTNISLSDAVHDSLISILMVGAYISISFITIEILNQLNIINLVSKMFVSVSFNFFEIDVVKSFLTGLLEITCGIMDLSKTCASPFIKTTLSSILIAFGGFSVMLQNTGFLNKLNIKISTILKQKLTQALICLVVSSILSFLFI